MADTAKAFDVNRNTLRKHYIERRSVVYDALPAFPDMESAIVDPDIFLRKLVDSCVTGIEKPFTVWTKNKEELQQLHCGKTAFADSLRRRRLDPASSLRLPAGGGDTIDPNLISYITSNIDEDLKGSYTIRIYSITVFIEGNYPFIHVLGNSSRRINSGRSNKIFIPGYEVEDVELLKRRRFTFTQIAYPAYSPIVLFVKSKRRQNQRLL